MNKRWNNKSGAGVKGAVVLALAMVISVGMLTACTGGNGNKQNAVDGILSSQDPQKNNDDKKNTVETTETPGQTNIQGTENKDLPAVDADKGTAPEAENKKKDKNAPETENKKADKNASEAENKEADKSTPEAENKEKDKNTPETESNDAPETDSDDNKGEEKKDTEKTKQKKADAKKDAVNRGKK